MTVDTFRSTSPNNDAGYSNRNFDDLLDSDSATADPAHRRELLERAERLMLSMPLYFFSSNKLVKAYVKGARTNPLNRLNSKHLYIAK
jgi:oligopeptide transport system substrate-binding protein